MNAIQELVKIGFDGLLTDKERDKNISAAVWDLRCLEEAKRISEYSKDPSKKCGALIVRDKNIYVGRGYNGLPQRIRDRDEYLQDVDKKLQIIIHAEINAIRFASQSGDVKGATIYVYPDFPCATCASVLIQYGIGRVVVPGKSQVDIQRSKWKESWELAEELFGEAGVEICRI